MNNNLNKHFRQIVLIGKNMELLGSNDLIFSTEKIKNITIEKWFPFIESISGILKSMEIGDEEIIFSRVESPADFLSGSYDFSFIKRKLGEREFIQWNIYDYTNVYSFLTKYQQLKNEKDIFRQKIEHHDLNIKNISDLFL
ncbi:MAG TPA: hypothetical protein ENJ53_01685 [Phaeodactylibacter sp.]|nr:hypothetical protein [Phaeodactylibacter sp.]